MKICRSGGCCCLTPGCPAWGQLPLPSDPLIPQQSLGAVPVTVLRSPRLCPGIPGYSQPWGISGSQQSCRLCCGRGALCGVSWRYLCSDPFAYRSLRVKSNKKVQWFCSVHILKGKLRECCFFMIFLVLYGNCGAPAPGPAGFAADGTGGFRDGTGNPFTL